MSNVFLRQIAPSAKWSQKRQTPPAVVQACLATFSDQPTLETSWEPPTRDEWRRAMLAIAKQVVVHIAGYRNHEEFTRDGCRFAWDVFGTIQVSSARRDH